MRRLLLVLALIGAVGPARPVLAAAKPITRDVQALIDAATERFRVHDYAEALTLYQMSYERTHFPRLLYMIGRCHQELGQWSLALARFEAFLSAEESREARVKAEEAIREIQARLDKAELVFDVEPAGAEVLVDDEVVGTVPLEPYVVKPGPHRVRVRAPGRIEEIRQVTLEGAGLLRLTIALKALPTPPREVTPPVQPPVVVKPVVPLRRSLSPWTWITLGTGLALLGGGAAAYGLGELDHREIADSAGYGSEQVTDMTRKRALDLDAQGNQRKTIGYALMGVGGAAVAGSIVLFILEAVGPSTEAPISAGAAPVQGGGLMSLQGSF